MAKVKSYFIKIDHNSRDGFDHIIGGINRDILCPNCEKPLFLHLSLDTRDRRLKGFNYPHRYIRLYYCMRCPLAWYDFQYLDHGDNIEIIKANTAKDKSAEEEWSSEINLDYFPERKITLQKIPSSLVKLFKKATEEGDLSESEEFKFAKLTDNFASDAVGNYPIADVVNQVGGYTYIPQNIDGPKCYNCERHGKNKSMVFLASLANNPKQELEFSYDGVQILFYICELCHTIHVQHCC